MKKTHLFIILVVFLLAGLVYATTVGILPSQGETPITDTEVYNSLKSALQELAGIQETIEKPPQPKIAKLPKLTPKELPIKELMTHESRGEGKAQLTNADVDKLRLESLNCLCMVAKASKFEGQNYIDLFANGHIIRTFSFSDAGKDATTYAIATNPAEIDSYLTGFYDSPTLADEKWNLAVWALVEADYGKKDEYVVPKVPPQGNILVYAYGESCPDGYAFIGMFKDHDDNWGVDCKSRGIRKYNYMRLCASDELKDYVVFSPEQNPSKLFEHVGSITNDMDDYSFEWNAEIQKSVPIGSTKSLNLYTLLRDRNKFFLTPGDGCPTTNYHKATTFSFDTSNWATAYNYKAGGLEKAPPVIGNSKVTLCVHKDYFPAELCQIEPPFEEEVALLFPEEFEEVPSGIIPIQGVVNLPINNYHIFVTDADDYLLYPPIYLVDPLLEPSPYLSWDPETGVFDVDIPYEPTQMQTSLAKIYIYKDDVYITNLARKFYISPFVYRDQQTRLDLSDFSAYTPVVYRSFFVETVGADLMLVYPLGVEFIAMGMDRYHLPEPLSKINSYLYFDGKKNKQILNVAGFDKESGFAIKPISQYSNLNAYIDCGPVGWHDDKSGSPLYRMVYQIGADEILTHTSNIKAAPGAIVFVRFFRSLSHRVTFSCTIEFKPGDHTSETIRSKQLEVRAYKCGDTISATSSVVGWAKKNTLSDCPVKCGDKKVEPDFGEECDDGNRVNTDGCTNNCKIAECGDGTVQIYVGYKEECDDGKQCSNGDDCTSNPSICSKGPSDCLTRNGDGCDSECKKECRNGKLDPGELCDIDGKNIVYRKDLISMKDVVIKGKYGLGNDDVYKYDIEEMCESVIGSDDCTDVIKIHLEKGWCSSDCKWYSPRVHCQDDDTSSDSGRAAYLYPECWLTWKGNLRCTNIHSTSGAWVGYLFSDPGYRKYGVRHGKEACMPDEYAVRNDNWIPPDKPLTGDDFKDNTKYRGHWAKKLDE